MSKCNYCGDSAHADHLACEEDFQLGEMQIAMEVAGAVSAGGDIEGLPSRVAMTARQARIPEQRLRELVIAGWVRAIERFLEDKALNEDEERRLIRLEHLFGLTHADLNASEAWQFARAEAA
jgi:hypothetical protein